MKQKISDGEIVSMFQRYISSNDPSEINKLKIEDLIAAESRLALRGINPKFSQIIKKKISELELKEARKHESRIRAWNLFTGLILGLAIAGIGTWLYTS